MWSDQICGAISISWELKYTELYRGPNVISVIFSKSILNTFGANTKCPKEYPKGFMKLSYKNNYMLNQNRHTHTHTRAPLLQVKLKWMKLMLAYVSVCITGTQILGLMLIDAFWCFYANICLNDCGWKSIANHQWHTLCRTFASIADRTQKA